MTVSVVTAWHNHLELADDYMSAILNGPDPDELIIVDDGSNPPLSFARIRLDSNQGYCAANNAGLEAAASDIVVFLNNDIELVQEGWLDRLVAAVEPGVLAGARIRVDLHTLVDGIAVPYLDGWCLAGLRDEIQDLGGFDDRLEEPAYYSDNLLCLEARAAGMTLREVPGVGLKHKAGVTTRGNMEAGARATRINYERYSERARQLLTPTTV